MRTTAFSTIAFAIAVAGCGGGDVDHAELVAELKGDIGNLDALPDTTTLVSSETVSIEEAVLSADSLELIAKPHVADDPDPSDDHADGQENAFEQQPDGVFGPDDEPPLAEQSPATLDEATVDAIKTISTKVTGHNEQLTQLAMTINEDRAATARLLRDLNKRLDEEVAARKAAENQLRTVDDEVSPHEIVPMPLEVAVSPANQWVLDVQTLKQDLEQLALQAQTYMEIIELAQTSQSSVALLAEDYPVVQDLAERMNNLAGRGAKPRASPPHTPKVHYIDDDSAVVSLQDGPHVRLVKGQERLVSGVSMTLRMSNPTLGSVVIESAGHDHNLAIAHD